MPSSIYGLVHTNVPDRDLLVSSLKVANSVKDTFSSKVEIDRFVVNTLGTKYKQIGLIFNNLDNTVPFFKEPAFGPLFQHFVSKAKTKGVVTFDLITCNFTSSDIDTRVHDLEKKLGVDIRYSVDKTGSVTNWVMESDNVDLKPLYFTDKIDTYTHTLGPSAVHMGFVVLEDGVKRAYMSGSGTAVKGLLVSTDYATYNGLSGIVQISTSFTHTLYLTENGNVYSSGSNWNGELGIGSTGFTPVSTPTLIPTISGVVQVVTGNRTSFFVTQTGDVYACGNNEFKTLGISGSDEIVTPTKIPNLSNITQVSTGSSYALALDNSGNVYGCGDNDVGQLGLGINTRIYSFTQIPTISGVSQIGCCTWTSVFLKQDRSVFACGINTGTFASKSYKLINETGNTNYNVPTVINVSNISKIACGAFHIVFLDIFGNLWATGLNNSGQYGNNTTNSSNSTPIEVNLGYLEPIQDYEYNPSNFTILDIVATDDSTFILAKETSTNTQYVFGAGFNSGGLFGFSYGITSQKFVKVKTSPTTYLSNVISLADSQLTFLPEEGGGGEMIIDGGEGTLETVILNGVSVTGTTVDVSWGSSSAEFTVSLVGSGSEPLTVSGYTAQFTDVSPGTYTVEVSITGTGTSVSSLPFSVTSLNGSASVDGNSVNVSWEFQPFELVNTYTLTLKNSADTAVATVSGIVNTETSYPFTGLENETYTVQIDVLNTANEIISTFSTEPVTVLVVSVTGVLISADNNLSVSWEATPSEPVTGFIYTLQKFNDPDFVDQSLSGTVSGDVTSAEFTSLSNGTYRVRIDALVGETIVGTTNTEPVTVLVVSVTGVLISADNNLSVSWEASEPVTGFIYTLQKFNDSEFVDQSLSGTLSGDVTSAEFTSLSNGTYRVRIDALVGETVVGTTDTNSESIDIDIFTDISVSTANSNITVNWTYVAGLTPTPNFTVRLFRGETQVGGDVTVSNSLRTKTFTNVPAGENYTVQVESDSLLLISDPINVPIQFTSFTATPVSGIKRITSTWALNTTATYKLTLTLSGGSPPTEVDIPVGGFNAFNDLENGVYSLQIDALSGETIIATQTRTNLIVDVTTFSPSSFTADRNDITVTWNYEKGLVPPTNFSIELLYDNKMTGNFVSLSTQSVDYSVNGEYSVTFENLINRKYKAIISSVFTNTSLNDSLEEAGTLTLNYIPPNDTITIDTVTVADDNVTFTWTYVPGDIEIRTAETTIAIALSNEDTNYNISADISPGTYTIENVVNGTYTASVSISGGSITNTFGESIVVDHYDIITLQSVLAVDDVVTVSWSYTPANPAILVSNFVFRLESDGQDPLTYDLSYEYDPTEGFVYSKVISSVPNGTYTVSLQGGDIVSNIDTLTVLKKNFLNLLKEELSTVEEPIFELTLDVLATLFGGDVEDAKSAEQELLELHGSGSRQTSVTVAIPNPNTKTIVLSETIIEESFTKQSLFKVNVVYIPDLSFSITFKGETVSFQVDLAKSLVTITGGENIDNSYGKGDKFKIGGQTFIVNGFGSLSLIPVPPPCFVKGSRILTPSGYRRVETLKNGDLVQTAKGKIVPVTVLSTNVGNTSERTAPFRIPKDFISRGVPSRDVGLSPDHAVMIKPGAWMFTKTLGRHLPEKVQQYNLGKSQTYYHVETPDYFKDDLVVDGMVVESYGINVADRVDFVLSEEKGGLIRVDTQSVLNRNLRN
jgi:alpha-tubulin suppressor-like RCC1 family protein